MRCLHTFGLPASDPPARAPWTWRAKSQRHLRCDSGHQPHLPALQPVPDDGKSQKSGGDRLATSAAVTFCAERLPAVDASNHRRYRECVNDLGTCACSPCLPGRCTCVWGIPLCPARRIMLAGRGSLPPGTCSTIFGSGDDRYVWVEDLPVVAEG